MCGMGISQLSKLIIRCFMINFNNCLLISFVIDEPRINDIKIENDNDRISFIVNAVGTDNIYKWSKNNIVLDSENEDITIEPSPPTLILSTIDNGNVIKVEASNSNILGETNSDKLQVYIFITPTCVESGTQS